MSRSPFAPLLVSALAVVALAATGCEEKKSAAPSIPPAAAPSAAAPTAAAGGEEITPEVMKEAQDIFAGRCTPCHGPQGKGDGPASAGLTPKPANFSDPAWQKSVTDEHIEKIISYGGGAVGKSPAMPPNPDLADKPVVKALRKHIRELAGK